jgi:hypothetical protein
VPEPEGSSPHSQQPAKDPYPEPGESTPHLPNLPKVNFDPILPSTPWSFKWTFPSCLPTKILYTSLPSPMSATCPAHLILLGLVCLIISGDEYKLWALIINTLNKRFSLQIILNYYVRWVWNMVKKWQCDNSFKMAHCYKFENRWTG